MILRTEKMMGIVIEVVSWFNVSSDIRIVASHECGLYETLGCYSSELEANKALNELILSI